MFPESNGVFSPVVQDMTSYPVSEPIGRINYWATPSLIRALHFLAINRTARTVYTIKKDCPKIDLLSLCTYDDRKNQRIPYYPDGVNFSLGHILVAVDNPSYVDDVTKILYERFFLNSNDRWERCYCAVASDFILYAYYFTKPIKTTHRLASAYYKTDKWKKIAQIIRRRDERVCQSCGAFPAIYVHHLTYDFFGKEEHFPGSLVTLCKECHANAHNFIHLQGMVSRAIRNKIAERTIYANLRDNV